MNNDWIDDYLMHHGIRGQKWGVRRFQNPDGSLTPRGRKRYLASNGQLTEQGKSEWHRARERAQNAMRTGNTEEAANAYRTIGELEGTSGRMAALKDESRLAKDRKYLYENGQSGMVTSRYPQYSDTYLRSISSAINEMEKGKKINKTLEMYRSIQDKLGSSNELTPEEKTLRREIDAMDKMARDIEIGTAKGIEFYDKHHAKEALAATKEESIRKAKEQGLWNYDWAEGVDDTLISEKWTPEQRMKEYERYFDMGGKDYFRDLYKRYGYR